MNHRVSLLDLMLKYSLYLLASLTIVLLLSSCIASVDEDKARLGQEFSLSVGQTVVIEGEDLEVTFIEVSEDSRCPRDVTCVWEGRVTAVIEISTSSSSEQMDLTQPGLTDAPARAKYEGYEMIYGVEPYPEKAEVEIQSDEYRLLMVINK